ncbi:PaaI family thioesterase [Marinagarivorans algicola]|nr:PaaI family thioesterase [Marinagarivorans algicola]
MDYQGTIRFTLLSQSNDEVTSKMPVEKGILNPFGIVNAGAIIWFADVTASVLLLENSNPQEGMKGFPLAININANLIGNAKSGNFFATSTYVKKGRTVSVVHTVVTDEKQNIIADVTTNHVLTQ